MSTFLIVCQFMQQVSITLFFTMHLQFPNTVTLFPSCLPLYVLCPLLKILFPYWFSIFKNQWRNCYYTVVKSDPTVCVCDSIDCSPPVFPVFHYLRVCSNSCPLSQWCYLTISFSATLFSFCLQSFPAPGSFPVSWLFTSGGQSIAVSATDPPRNI